MSYEVELPFSQCQRSGVDTALMAIHVYLWQVVWRSPTHPGHGLHFWCPPINHMKTTSEGHPHTLDTSTLLMMIWQFSYTPGQQTHVWWFSYTPWQRTHFSSSYMPWTRTHFSWSSYTPWTRTYFWCSSYAHWTQTHFWWSS